MKDSKKRLVITNSISLFCRCLLSFCLLANFGSAGSCTDRDWGGNHSGAWMAMPLMLVLFGVLAALIIVALVRLVLAIWKLCNGEEGGKGRLLFSAASFVVGIALPGPDSDKKSNEDDAFNASKRDHHFAERPVGFHPLFHP